MTHESSHDVSDTDILDAMRGHVAVIDSKGIILRTNATWRAFALANGARDLQGMDVGTNYFAVIKKAAQHGDIIAHETIIALNGVLRGVLPSFMLEYPCMTREGERWFLMHVSPLQNLQGAVIVHTDITPMKEAETRLLDDVSRKHAEVELRARFVSMASHEFRTPLASIMTATELILRYRERMPPERIDEQLHKIIAQVKHMNHLIDDMLLYGKTQTGRLEYRPERTDVAAYTRAIVDDMRALDNGTHVMELSCAEQLGELLLDPVLWRVVLNNLVSNALKFSLPNSRISIRLYDESGVLVLEVTDEGIGIPNEELPRVFEAFYRASNHGGVLGTGLGLAIVKHAVELHHGTITVSSQLGAGTSIVVKLPIVR